MNELVNYDAVCRTAAVLPSLFKSLKYLLLVNLCVGRAQQKQYQHRAASIESEWGCLKPIN